MAFPDDPLDPENIAIDRIRLLIGDTDPDDLLISNDLYDYFLSSNQDQESQATIKALQYLVAKFARYVNEEIGDHEIDYSSLYTHYKELLSKYTNDPKFSIIGSFKPYCGGISLSDIEANKSDSDNNINPFHQGWFTDQFKGFRR